MAKTLTILYYLVFFFVYIGFVFHKSINPAIGPYTIRYIIFLLIIGAGFILPIIFLVFVKKYGKKTVAFSTLPAIALLAVSYIIFSAAYYHTRAYRFDPFLQASPPNFDDYFIGIKPKAKNNIIIVTLGGSTTANLHLPESKRYPRVLEILLQKAFPGRQITVFNAGMEWYTSKHSLINYVTNIRDLRPDIVIIMHAINDIVRSCSDPDVAYGGYTRLWSHFYGPSINALFPPSFEEYVFGEYMEVWFSRLRYIESDVSLDYFRSLPDFRRYLTNLVQYIKADGSTVLLMTQPSIYKHQMTEAERDILWFGKKMCKSKRGFLHHIYPSASSMKNAMLAFNSATLEVAREMSTPVIDMDSLIPKTADYFVDDVHYTEKASNIIASNVNRYLVNTEIIGVENIVTEAQERRK